MEILLSVVSWTGWCVDDYKDFGRKVIRFPFWLIRKGCEFIYDLGKGRICLNPRRSTNILDQL